jgi:hypothetical protein
MVKLLLTAGLFAADAGAQCAQCFRTAAARQAAEQQAANWGIAALMLPTLLLLAGFCYLLWKRQDG